MQTLWLILGRPIKVSLCPTHRGDQSRVELKTTEVLGSSFKYQMRNLVTKRIAFSFLFWLCLLSKPIGAVVCVLFHLLFPHADRQLKLGGRRIFSTEAKGSVSRLAELPQQKPLKTWFGLAKARCRNQSHGFGVHALLTRRALSWLLEGRKQNSLEQVVFEPISECQAWTQKLLRQFCFSSLHRQAVELIRKCLLGHYPIKVVSYVLCLLKSYDRTNTKDAVVWLQLTPEISECRSSRTKSAIGTAVSQAKLQTLDAETRYWRRRLKQLLTAGT
jgi:hypothetical protein